MRAIFIWVTIFRTISALCLAGLLVAPALTGCAVTPVIAAARIALDGASMVATGKTSNGHGLSALTGEDCEPSRALGGGRQLGAGFARYREGEQDREHEYYAAPRPGQ